MKTIRVDYHFHPNLPKEEQKALEKAKEWWRVYQENQIEVVIVTEHSYKNPKRAYEMMKATKPAEMTLIPGMEYITHEGVDLVMFSHSERLYNYPELVSYKLSYESAVQFIESHDDIEAFVTHPYVLSKTGIIKNLGYSQFQHYLKRLKAVEILSVGGMQRVISLVKHMDHAQIISRRIAKIQSHRLNKSMRVPEHDYHLHDLKFIAVGSDAHHFNEVGNCLEIPIFQKSYKGIYHAITHAKDAVIHMNYQGHHEKKPHIGVVRSTLTVLREYFIKQPSKLRKNRVLKERTKNETP